MNTKKLTDSLQKVLGSANNEDFYDVTSAENNENEDINEEVEEITEDEVEEAMDEDRDSETEQSDGDSSEDVETEISVDEGEEVDDEDEVEDLDDGETIEDVEDSDEGDDESVEDDEDDTDGDFSDEQPSEEDIVEVNNIEEDDDSTPSEEDEVVEVNDVEEVVDDDLDGIEDDDIDEISDDEINEASEELDIGDDDAQDEVEDLVDDDVANEAEEIEEITDEEVEEAESSADNVVIVDDEATAGASELLASHGYQFETDACGKLCITGCDESECNVEVVEDIPNDLQVEPNDVSLILHESASEDPFYSVLIKGKPVASIHLKDQEQNDDEAKRDFFVSSDYPKALTNAMVKAGVNSVLDSVKAKKFVASVKNCELAKEMKAEAKKEMDEEIKASAIEMKDKFINCVKLALAGMNKNFFNNENDLKGAVYNAFANFGASKEVASKETEKVFANADSFFDSVVDKAQELMGFDENSFNTIASAVSTSGIGNREVETFESKLVKGNNPVVASAFAAQEEVTASVVQHKKLTFKKHIG